MTERIEYKQLRTISDLIDQVNVYGYHDICNNVLQYDFSKVWHTHSLNETKVPKFELPSNKLFGCSITEYAWPGLSLWLQCRKLKILCDIFKFRSLFEFRHQKLKTKINFPTASCFWAKKPLNKWKKETIGGKLKQLDLLQFPVPYSNKWKKQEI